MRFIASVAIWTFYSIAVLFTALRLIGRSAQLRNNAWDDWTMIGCIILLTVVSAIGQVELGIGMERDMWPTDKVTQKGDLEPEDITKCLFYSWVQEFPYGLLSSMTKISILLMYLRIFPHTRLRNACYILIGVTVMYGVAWCVSVCFACVPISLYWQRWDGNHPGNCSSEIPRTYILGGVNMVLDVLIFLLPVPSVLTLQMGWKKKIGMVLIFTIGFFIIRFTKIFDMENSTNPTVDFGMFGLWSFNEIVLGIICASIPGIAQLVKRMFPRLFTSSTPIKSTSSSSSSTRKSGSRGYHKRIPSTEPEILQC